MNLLQEQKTIKKRVNKKNVSFIKIIIKQIIFIINKIISKIYIIIKQYPKISIYFIIIFINIILIRTLFLNLLDNYNNNIPKNIIINIENQNLRDKLSSIIFKTIEDAKEYKYGKKWLISELNNIILKYDEVNVIDIRFETNDIIKISITNQNPLFIIENDFDKFLIGDSMRFMKKINKNTDEYSELPKLFSNDLKLYSKAFGIKQKNAINYSWFYKHLKYINSIKYKYNDSQLNIVQVDWKNGIGFNLILENFYKIENINNIILPSAQNNFINIVIGNDNFENKFDKILQIIEETRKKNILVKQIDLNYTNKALIKLSDNTNIEKSLKKDKL